jgi:hypothetical protein
MRILKSLNHLTATIGMEAENTDITNKKAYKKVSTFGLGEFGNHDWQYELTITYGSADNFLHVKTFSGGEAAIIGRGIFDKVQCISFMINFVESHRAQFIVIPMKRNRTPALPDYGVAFEINPEIENQHGARFELRFIAVNNVSRLYGTGFAVSDPGEPDDGVAIFLTKRKAIIMIDEALRKAQRLQGNRKLITTFEHVLSVIDKEEIKK